MAKVLNLSLAAPSLREPGSTAKASLVWLMALVLTLSFATPSLAAGEGTFTLGTTSGPVAGGTSVVITGTAFVLTADDLPTVDYVKFGSNNATSFVVNSATQITAIAPAGSAGVVSVTVGDRVLSSAYTYVSLPTVSSLSPTTGPLGGTNTVVITGTNFVGLSGAGAVTFGGTNATSYTVNSATQITAVAPAHVAGTVPVIVIAAGGSVAKAGYIYVSSPPTVTSISPKGGVLTGATSVVITGTNFFGVSGASAVKFGSNNATSFVVNSSTQITAVAPAGTAGVVSILVTGADGTGTLGLAYTYAAISTITSATQKAYFAASSSSLRESQFAQIFAIAAAVKDKKEIKIFLTSKRWAAESLSLSKARTTWVVKALKLAGVNASAVYGKVHKVGTSGSRSTTTNNVVTITATWTN